MYIKNIYIYILYVNIDALIYHLVLNADIRSMNVLFFFFGCPEYSISEIWTIASVLDGARFA